MSFHKSPFSGFPFDDDQEDTHFRSQLDDIAARHPQLAQHFGSFPFRSGSRTRSQIPEHFTQQSRFADEPFVDRFERFGFPFDKPFREEDQTPYHKRYPKYYPEQNPQEDVGEPSSSNQDYHSENAEVDSNKIEQEEPERGRRPKQNIQQSNTVDLGQPQEPVDDRNQRSMSAPPPNNRPRFVSSVNIPVNQPKEKTNVAHDNSQASAPSHPQERVIPIHVEGRDEPVLPKTFASQNTSQPHAHQQQPQPCSDKFFTQRSPNFSQYFHRDQPFQNDWFPRGFHGKHPQAESNTHQAQRGQSPKPEPSQQSANSHRQPEPHVVHPEVKTEKEEPKSQETSKPQVPGKLDPIDQIKSIQKDVSELMTQVDQFKGKPKDKHYLYLDEMLTRNLIKLDNIDTQGQENIRQARKEAIKCIEKCISILESKANSNVSSEPQCDKTMEVENAEGLLEQSEKDNPAEVVQEENTMEVESTPPSKEEAMEIEPVTTENTKSAEIDTIESNANQKLDESVTNQQQENVLDIPEIQKDHSGSDVEHIKDKLEIAESTPETSLSENVEQTNSEALPESNTEALVEDEKILEDVKSEGIKDSNKNELEVTNEKDKKGKKKIKKEEKK
ncbi:hypothetical protein WA026_010639 [Henosepilachna vigintioctopunctata]|uniref:BAG domain-containing protein n=1 Tax=Henosepilachna vigintioctopunctata TaxID=420089 RepID=A0AAW1UPL5_9CUCU